MSCGTQAQDSVLGDPDDARLLRFFPSDLAERELRTAGTAYCWYCELLVALNSTTLRQPAPSPVLHLLWLRTPLPNLPVRAPAADAFTEEPLKNALLVLRTALAVLLTVAPDHCGPPGPVVSPVAVLQLPWLRNSTTAPSCNFICGYCCLAVHLCRALLDLGYERNHNHATTQCLLQLT
jgi:hypothetical protein